MPTASMRFGRDGPRTPASARRERWEREHDVDDAHDREIRQPSCPPLSAPSARRSRATATEISRSAATPAPCSTRENTSRPSWSVPAALIADASGSDSGRSPAGPTARRLGGGGAYVQQDQQRPGAARRKEQYDRCARLAMGDPDRASQSRSTARLTSTNVVAITRDRPCIATKSWREIESTTYRPILATRTPSPSAPPRQERPVLQPDDRNEGVAKRVLRDDGGRSLGARRPHGSPMFASRRASAALGAQQVPPQVLQRCPDRRASSVH